MDMFRINGQKKLQGTVKISGAKNAILPIMAATLLTDGKSYLRNVPNLNDIQSMNDLLVYLGASIEVINDTMVINTENVNSFEAPYELVNKMRASTYVLGPCLARFGRAKVAFPGGCAIGMRPVDLHLMAMQKLGADLHIEHGYICAEAKNGLIGAEIEFPIVSVGATANCLMACVMAKGESFIKNIALEPEIESLIQVLILMGANIEKKNKNDLLIKGVDKLKPFDMMMIPDRIEAGTMLLAAAITKSSITVSNCEPLHLSSLIYKMEEVGCKFEIGKDYIKISPAENIKSVDITTSPYPGFPTDLQAQFLAYMCVANGVSYITDTVFPERFMHVSELIRLGANISLEHKTTALLKGIERFQGAEVKATDLRASAALVLAGLAAEGETNISQIYHIDRGYEKIEEKLRGIGADIIRI